MSEEVKIEDIKNKRNPPQKAEDFIGWKSEDGKLEVIGIHGKQGGKTTFKVICHKCKEDKELFPFDYFISDKPSLKSEGKPCGCAKSPRWNKEQYLVLAHRAAKDRFIVYGFAEEFHGAHTKLNLECLKDGHKWTASTNRVMNGSGCPKCKYDAQRTDEQEALDKCRAICEVERYEPLGFPDGYKNAKDRFEYRCSKHGKQNVSYNDFVNGGKRCRGCWKERQKEVLRENGNGNGYYPERKDEQDFLYVLNFNNKYIKVGRSFDVERRLGKNELQKDSGISNIVKLRIFTAAHQEIYDTEQELHEELRERNFQHYLDWTNECFENDCLFILNKLLDTCGLEEVSFSK